VLACGVPPNDGVGASSGARIERRSNAVTAAFAPLRRVARHTPSDQYR
jgi:hypothetical protein